MIGLASRASLLVLLVSLAGCAPSAYNVAVGGEQAQGGDGYCHKKLQSIGPTETSRPAQIGSGDVIDYYGPCNGPTVSDQIQKQRRYEQFRFGREYMDEG
jgi:hypothetical protein